MPEPIHARTIESISAELYGIYHNLQFLTDMADACVSATVTIRAETIGVHIGRLAVEVKEQMQRLDALYSPIFQMERISHAD